MSSDDLLARRIADHLDDSVSPRVAQALAAARERALSSQMRASADAPVVRVVALRRAGLAGLALAGLLAGAACLEGLSASADAMADLDAQLLSDELPARAYLDPGFHRFAQGLD